MKDGKEPVRNAGEAHSDAAMISARNVDKFFWIPHQIQALCGVSLEVAAGEVVVVIGPSGSGKSTFLRCLNRLEYADAGEIIIDGWNVLAADSPINQIRAEVGMVFQSFNLFPHLSVLDNVVLAPHIASGTHETRRAMADLVLRNLAQFIATGEPVAEVPWSAAQQSTASVA